MRHALRLFKRPQPERKEERRRYPRINHSVRVSYQIGNNPLHPDCYTKDISEGGIRLNLYQKLANGTSVKLYIYFQDAKEPVLLLGKVVWTKETPGRDYPFETGIEFDFIDSSLRSKIQSCIQSMPQK